MTHSTKQIICPHSVSHNLFLLLYLSSSPCPIPPWSKSDLILGYSWIFYYVTVWQKLDTQNVVFLHQKALFDIAIILLMYINLHNQWIKRTRSMKEWALKRCLYHWQCYGVTPSIKQVFFLLCVFPHLCFCPRQSLTPTASLIPLWRISWFWML